MAHHILTETAVSISELKANPMKVVASGQGMPVVVLNHNVPAFYCVPATTYEAMMDLLDDLELIKLAEQRKQEASITVSLNAL